MYLLIAFFVFVFGTIIGSFFNVVLLRKNTGETIVSGRSRCFSCGRIIAWYDNIPLLSFLILRGRCRICQSKISYQYFIVEVLTGTLAVFVYAKIPLLSLSMFLFYFATMASLLLVALYDTRTKIIDSQLLYIFAGFACVSAFLRWSSSGFDERIIISDIFISAMIWFFFWALYYFSGETWMGRGDSSVAWWCALFLGFPFSIAMLLFAFWIGSIFGIALIIFNYIRSGRRAIGLLKLQIPFAPFLALGTFCAWYFVGIVNAYFMLFY